LNKTILGKHGELVPVALLGRSDNLSRQAGSDPVGTSGSAPYGSCLRAIAGDAPGGRTRYSPSLFWSSIDQQWGESVMQDPSLSEFSSLSGPQALRAHFFPRQTLQIQEAAKILGVARETLYRRSYRGTNGLKISGGNGSRQYVLLEDLIAYLFPSSINNTDAPSAPPQPEPIRKVGRPRKSTTGGAK